MAALVWASAAEAHFPFVVAPQPGGTTVLVLFGESPDDVVGERMLSYVDGMTVSEAGGEPLTLTAGDGVLTAAGDELSVYGGSKTLGVMSRGGKTFLVKYAAVGGPVLGQWSWNAADFEHRLEAVPALEDGAATLSVTFDGEPVEGAEVSVDGEELKTDGDGEVTLPNQDGGPGWLRVSHVEDAAGTHEGEDYTEVRHYLTVTYSVPAGAADAESSVNVRPTDFADLPAPLTSFGATRLGDRVYAYGGHTGDSHEYSKEDQSDVLYALDLNGGGWSEAARGERVQGNALVAAGGRLALLGGFTAMNAEGEDQDLRSQAAVRAFDPESGAWSELPSLPEPRSSFDAFADGSTVYVTGGWSMQGDAEAVWHGTAWSMDVSADEPAWVALPEPPMKRRALATAVVGGRFYVIGGMTESDGPTGAVSIYDPASGEWSRGPSLPGQPMNGFGCAAAVVDGRLVVTTYAGDVLRLSEDCDAWERLGTMTPARFFHRLVPHEGGLLVLGGANMEEGKFPQVDRIDF